MEADAPPAPGAQLVLGGPPCKTLCGACGRTGAYSAKARVHGRSSSCVMRVHCCCCRRVRAAWGLFSIFFSRRCGTEDVGGPASEVYSCHGRCMREHKTKELPSCAAG